MDALEDLQKYVESKLREHSTELRDMEMDGSGELDYYEGLVDAYGHMLAKIKEVLNSQELTMEYHFVVKWSEEEGWQVDYETTIANFDDQPVFIPNLGEWAAATDDTETGDQYSVIGNELTDILYSFNKGENLFQ